MLKVLLIFTVFLTSTTYAAHPACEGPMRLTTEKCGTTLLINDQVIARCLDKLSPAFKTFVGKCVANKESNLAQNANVPSAAEYFSGSCGGDLAFDEVTCGTSFYLLGKNSSTGPFSSPCNDLNDANNDYVKDLRNYCESILKNK